MNCLNKKLSKIVIFSLKISPLERWVEIHTYRVDHTTVIQGGFPNTAIRVDFKSSSGHDAPYTNKIMYFDSKGNITISNYCTMKEHSGSVDTWTLYYLGKIYKFTYHWYW